MDRAPVGPGVTEVAPGDRVATVNAQGSYAGRALVAWLVFGEGYQNNHHHSQRSANFAMRAGELDLGYGLCLAAQQVGLLEVVSEPGAVSVPSA